MKQYAQKQIAALVAKFAAEAKRAAEGPDADAVHDLRVSIRRLSRGLRVFTRFFPPKSCKHIRRELSELMSAAAEVRDRDIAAELLEKAGVAQRARPVIALGNQRREAAEALQQALQNVLARHAPREWKGVLEL
jgi:CHAD domain-containing protein